MSSMLRRLLLIVSLALLFGLGQQGAAVHAISHLAEQQQESQQNKKTHPLSFCDQCAAYANLASAIDADLADFAFLSGAPVPSGTSACPHLSGHACHYSARAPPILA